MLYKRLKEADILNSLQTFPVTAITGPRQCGKSTLARALVKRFPKTVYLDLERPSDFQKLQNAEWFLASQKDSLICIDEIQRRPELFPLIRSLVDEWEKPGCFLVLGSASRDLLRQSSESLAGRIAYKRLTPFLWPEATDLNAPGLMERYVSAGAFPRSILAPSEKASFEWRENFITSFLERDLAQWSLFSPFTMRRLWQMLAHYNGQTLNYSQLASSLGTSPSTVRSYIDLLASTYMVELIPPYISNLGKRLVKAPKMYIADSGINAALLGLRSFAEIAGHPVLGSLWEQIVLSNVLGCCGAEFFHYRSSNGAEIDFVIKLNNKIYALECKASFEPTLSRGNYSALEDIAPDHAFIVTPSPDSWPFKSGIDVVSLGELLHRL